MTRWLALLLVGCGGSSLPADHPCKTENNAAFVAECNLRIVAAYEESVEAGDKQKAECDRLQKERCK